MGRPSLNGQPRKHFGILLLLVSSSLTSFQNLNVNYDADLSQPKDLYLFFFFVALPLPWVVLYSFLFSPFVVLFWIFRRIFNSFVNVFSST